MTSNTINAGVYRHYTGLMVLVLGVARHSETEEKFVCYIPLGPKAGPRITVRPVAMFFEEVEADGAKQPRFKFIGAEMPEDLAAEYRQTSNWGEPEK
ncbi:MAG: DUF1653 domain-containing protein [bacterium]|nr:DUF1653 domain-containing protein [bacterium]